MPRIPVIVRALSDKDMIQFMARENQEDYNTNFLAMLEVWEAGERFCAEQHIGAIAPKIQVLDIAALLGWTTVRTDKEEKQQGEIRANTTARVCADASALIQGGHVTRQDLRDISVHAVRELCGGLMTRLNGLERYKARPHAAPGSLAHLERAAIDWLGVIPCRCGENLRILC